MKPPHIKNIYQRYWAMSKTTLDVGSVTAPHHVLVVPIPKEALNKTAVSFINFNRATPKDNHYAMMVQVKGAKRLLN